VGWKRGKKSASARSGALFFDSLVSGSFLFLAFSLFLRGTGAKEKRSWLTARKGGEKRVFFFLRARFPDGGGEEVRESVFPLWPATA
jgi:hypothetical protein